MGAAAESDGLLEGDVDSMAVTKRRGFGGGCPFMVGAGVCSEEVGGE